MSLINHGVSALAAAGALALLLPGIGAARAAETYVMKIGTATINESQHEWCKRFAAMVEKDSGGRIKGEIYPASQLGSIPREIEGVQFGSIQIYVGPPEFLVGVDQRYEVVSSPGLVDNLAHEVRMVTDPELQKLMFSFGADKGLHGNVLFIAQPSSVIGRTPIRHLADFKGKKLRVLASDMQEDMVKSLGASPVAMTLGDVLPALQQGSDRRIDRSDDHLHDHAFLGRRQIHHPDQPALHLLDGVRQQGNGSTRCPRICRALSTTTDSRQGRRRGQSLGGRVLRQTAQREIFAQHGELISHCRQPNRPNDDENSFRPSAPPSPSASLRWRRPTTSSPRWRSGRSSRTRSRKGLSRT